MCFDILLAMSAHIVWVTSTRFCCLIPRRFARPILAWFASARGLLIAPPGSSPATAVVTGRRHGVEMIRERVMAVSILRLWEGGPDICSSSRAQACKSTQTCSILLANVAVCGLSSDAIWAGSAVVSSFKNNSSKGLLCDQ